MRSLTLLFIFISSISFAQQKAPVDARLYSKYTKEELKKLQKENPEELKWQNYLVGHCYQVMDLPAEKGSAHEIKGTVSVKNTDNIDVYALKLEPSEKDYQYYKIEGTTKMLVILSLEQIKTYYNQIK